MFDCIVNNSNIAHSWIELLSAALTPTIAIVGGHIAYQQWKTSEKSRKQALFNLRYEHIFKPILEICEGIYDAVEKETIKDNKTQKKYNNMHSKNLKSIKKYRFLLKDDDFVNLLSYYDAFRLCVSNNFKINDINEDYKNYLTIKLSKIYNLMNVYLNIENELYCNIWEHIGTIFVKFYKFIALNILVNKITKVFKRKKKKVYDATK